MAQGNNMNRLRIMPVAVSPSEELLLFNKNFFAESKARAQFVVILNWPAVYFKHHIKAAWSREPLIPNPQTPTP
jgi:hypothetical protein